MRTSKVILCVGWAASVAACGATVSSNDGGGDAAVAVDGAQPSDGGGGNLDAGAVLPEKAGTVTITAVNAMIAGMSFSTTAITGAFSESFGGRVNAQCAARSVGMCQVISCAGNGDAGVGADAGSSNTVSAGNITVSGGMGMPIVMMPGAMGAYSFTEMAQRFNAGTNVMVSASGSPMGVPNFMGSVVVPAPVTVTAPLLNPLMPYPVMRSMPLEVSWTGATTGSVRVFMAAGAGGIGGAAAGDSVNCIVPARGGRGTVPPEALAALPAGRGVMGVAAANTQDVMAGDFRVSIIATNSSSLPGGQIMIQ
jgi:hypothetical protein